MKALEGLRRVPLWTQWNQAPFCETWIASMTDDETPVTLSDAEYDAIEEAVMETARGRWFLREFAKRNRNADTEAVLAALSKLEQAMQSQEADGTLAAIRSNLRDMADAILRAKAELGLARSEGDDFKHFVHAASEAAGPDREADFQAVAEQRIRHLLQTLRDIENHVHDMTEICGSEGADADGERPFSRSAQLTHEHGPRPPFLM
jgi:hypothetical protein